MDTKVMDKVQIFETVAKVVFVLGFAVAAYALMSHAQNIAHF